MNKRYSYLLVYGVESNPARIPAWSPYMTYISILDPSKDQLSPSYLFANALNYDFIFHAELLDGNCPTFFNLTAHLFLLLRPITVFFLAPGSFFYNSGQKLFFVRPMAWNNLPHNLYCPLQTSLLYIFIILCLPDPIKKISLESRSYQRSMFIEGSVARETKENRVRQSSCYG